MSAQLFNEIAQLKVQMDKAMELIGMASVQIAAHAKRMLDYENERREQNKALQTIKDQVASLHAMKAGLEEDAKRIGIATRDRIDPTTAKMPQVLKSMGYGAKR